ncbi:autophagocytosis associated protein [Mucidula mucida]|nr:autophagocytosis associated protein [Mucidula mucida]
MHAIQQQLFAVREYLSPVLKESKFKEHGRITPEEFVAAGDFLTYKFGGGWRSSKAREYLPSDKQYLVTRGVPCLRRATALAYTDADEDAERLLSFGDSFSSPDEKDEWVETHAATGMAGLSLDTPGDIPDIDDIPDMEEDDLEAGDEATASSKPPAPASGVIDASQVEVAKGNLLQVRTYDVMITYDKYYQTPRIWLLGYDENRTPLTPAQIFQDVSADHALKTVTIEAFPHSTSLQAASVHPCKHASVMKKVIERMNSSVVAEQLAQQKASSKDKKKWFSRKSSSTGKELKVEHPEEEEVEGMRVDFYLVVFLKFIASIVPTIEVDSTASF